MCYVDLEPCEIFNEKLVKAKKTYKCTCCKITINPGERYLTHFSIFENEPESSKLCIDCYRDRAIFAQAHGGMSCTPSWFENILSNCISEGDEESEVKWKPILNRIVESKNNAKSKVG